MQRPDRRLSLLLLTIFLDLVGFSLIFPLFPAMLGHYLAAEGTDGALGALIRVLEWVGGPSDPGRLAVLFGGVVGAIYSALQFVFAPLWGGLSDRIGRRRVLLVTIGGMAIGYLIWCFSRSFLLFVLSRVVAGTMSGNISVANAAVADLTGRTARTKAMALVGVAFGLGFLIGPALGGILSVLSPAVPTEADPTAAAGGLGLHRFSMVAGGAFLLSALNWVLVLASFRETIAPEARAGRRRGVERRILLRRLGIPGVDRVNAIWFIYLLGFSGMEFTLTFLAADRLGYAPHQNAYLFVFSGTILVAVQGGLVRRLAPRFGERRLATAGLVLVLPGFLLLGLARSEIPVYAALGFLSVGGALISPSMTSLVSLYAGAEEQGLVLGVFRSLGALSRTIGPLAACLAYWRLGPEPAYAIATVMMIVPVVLSTRLPPVVHPPASSPPDSPASSRTAGTPPPSTPA